MKIGDLVIRKPKGTCDHSTKAAKQQRQKLGIGIVVATKMAGNPVHKCLSVYYGKVGQTWDIAASLMEHCNESG